MSSTCLLLCLQKGTPPLLAALKQEKLNAKNEPPVRSWACSPKETGLPTEMSSVPLSPSFFFHLPVGARALHRTATHRSSPEPVSRFKVGVPLSPMICSHSFSVCSPKTPLQPLSKMHYLNRDSATCSLSRSLSGRGVHVHEIGCLLFTCTRAISRLPFCLCAIAHIRELLTVCSYYGTEPPPALPNLTKSAPNSHYHEPIPSALPQEGLRLNSSRC
ncbi:hypothetical protein LZ32DRAFT_57496 [Colletotrichum eremochloae]|nr:hypothetical protein LZ32DRAFT_57496 [Colletotrichum eremochloae]